ncbi:MAG: shikimate dehydrogenase [Candidatus Gracilibacteria bacterium]
MIGFPLAHSLSPSFHNTEYTQRGQDAVMLAFEHEDLSALIQVLRTLKIGLTAVTLPFKEAILPFLDLVDPLAKRLQSVNTVLQKEGKLLGHNTDYFGISKALEGVLLKGKKVLLLGAGGVAKPAAVFVQDAGAELFCLNRNRERAEELVRMFGGSAIDETVLSNMRCDVVINATPLGLAPDVDQTPLDASFLRAGQIVFDIVYNPEETRLLREAKAAGAETRSGLTMFKAQALEQIRLWETLILNS